MKAKTQKLSRLFTIIGIILIVVGVLTASLNQTAGRTINIKTVSIVSDEGNIIQAIMYLPKSATKETPAPGVLAVHGGNSSRYAMSNISQEFARRGYVVMSIDQSFNGQSDRGTNDHQGAEAVMKYMTTLEFVDQSKLGVMGHSAGAAVVAMAADNPQFGVKAGISLGAGPMYPADAAINTAVIVGIGDENTGPRGSDTQVIGPGYYAKSSALAQAFGVGDGSEIVPEQDYGSIEENNLRVFYQPNCGHLGLLYSNEGIGMALEFMGRVLDIDYSIDVNSQTWLIREFSTGIAYAGLFLLAFGLMGTLLLRSKAQLIRDVAAKGHAKTNAVYWIFTVVMALIPLIGLQPIYMAGKTLMTSISQNIFAMEHMNGVLFWMLCSAMMILAVSMLMKKFTKDYDWNFDKNVLKISAKDFLASLKIAVLVALAMYLAVYLAGFFCNVCIRLYNTEVHIFTPTRFAVFWAYLPIMFLYYFIMAYVHVTCLFRENQPAWVQYVLNAVVSSFGMICILSVWYGTNMIMGINYLFVWRFALGVLMNFLPCTIITCFLTVS